jgi:hypothetical protein
MKQYEKDKRKKGREYDYAQLHDFLDPMMGMPNLS